MIETACVYVHVFPNGKMYFGVTSQKPKERWGSDGRGYKYQSLMWKAIQKYGWNNIRHIILFDKLSFSDALNEEQRLIQKYGTNEPEFGYNNTLGGEGVLGYKYTEEQLVNHRYWLGRHHSEETKRKLSEQRKGRKMSFDQIQKLSESKRGKPSPLRGRTLSAEHKQKISDSLKGSKNHCKPHTLETRISISEASKGRTVSQETREKLRQRALEQWKRQKQNKINTKKENTYGTV